MQMTEKEPLSEAIAEFGFRVMQHYERTQRFTPVALKKRIFRSFVSLQKDNGIAQHKAKDQRSKPIIPHQLGFLAPWLHLLVGSSSSRALG